MDDANGVVLEALPDDVLDESIVTDAIGEALHILQGAGAEDRAIGSRQKSGK